MSLPPLDQLVRPRSLPQPRPWSDLPRWALSLRDELLRWDSKYFDGSAEPWLRLAGTYELLEMEQEVLDLPDEILRPAIRAAEFGGNG